ncbi:MAG: hypothetical protein FWG81_00060 [Betaproteobacteria bacterium]|nr:hypothetical protein [Betaproteobacteria bacterium]
MALTSRVSLGIRPGWIDRRRSVQRVEPGRITPPDDVNPDGSPSLHEQLMAAFRSSRLIWFNGSKGKKENKGKKILRSRLAKELAMLDLDEKQRLLKKTGFNAVA